MKPKAILLDLGSTVFPYRESDARYFLKNFFTMIHKRSGEVEKESIWDYIDLYLNLVEEYGKRSAQIGYRDEDLEGRLRRFLMKAGIEPVDLEIWTETHREAFVESVFVPEEHVIYLQRLSEEFPLAVVTNYPDHATIEKLLERHGLRETFSAVSVSGAVGYRKPHKAIFLDSLRKLNVKPSSDVVMVGDRWLEDVEGARAVGLTGVLSVQWKVVEPPGDFKAPRLYRLTDLKRLLYRL